MMFDGTTGCNPKPFVLDFSPRPEHRP